MVLNMLPPALQNALIISFERICLAQGRIYASLNQQCVAEIGVGIVFNKIHKNRDFSGNYRL